MTYYNPPPQVVSATGAQPNAQNKLPPFLEASQVNSPIPNSDAATNLAEILAVWNPPLQHDFVAGGRQAYEPRKLPAALTAVRVDSPVPNINALSSSMVSVLAWQPADPLPMLPRYLPPIQVTLVAKGPYANLWLATVLQSWVPPDGLPTMPRTLSPGIPGQSVDRPGEPPLGFYIIITDDGVPQRTKFLPQGARVDSPAPNSDALTNLMAMITAAWQMPDPAPQQPRKLPPGLPGMSVDNPPVIARRQADYPADAGMPQQARYITQGAASISVQGPYANLWMATVIQSWAPADGLPTLRRNLNPAISAVRVDNPPFTHAGRLPWGNFTDWTWVPPDPQPQAPGKLSPGITGATVNNPPFTHYGRLAQTNAIIWQWVPPDPQPVQRGPLPPSLTAVRVDNPPFGVPQLWTTVVLSAWQPSDALPIRLRQLAPQPFMVTYVPFARAWLPSVVAAWMVDPILLPTTQRKLSPGIPGQSVDVPVTAPRRPIQQPDDQTLPFLRRLLVRPFVAAIPGVPYAPAWLPSIVLSWAPPAPLPTLTRNKLSPAITAVPVNNPPFPGTEVPLPVVAWWVSPPPMPPMPIHGIFMRAPAPPISIISIPRLSANIKGSPAGNISFTGFIVADTMIVTQVLSASGSITAGAKITGSEVVPGTTVVSFQSGVPGGAGSYKISPEQTVGGPDLQVTFSGVPIAAPTLIANIKGVSKATIKIPFTGFIVADTLLISQIESDVIVLGAHIIGDDVADVTIVTSFESGTGGVGAYKISPSQTVGGPEFQVIFFAVIPVAAPMLKGEIDR